MTDAALLARESLQNSWDAARSLRDMLDQQVQVNLPGGSLTIEWHGEGHPVMMTGPASTVFEGQILI